jgi:hypothetical protein
MGSASFKAEMRGVGEMDERGFVFRWEAGNDLE